MARTGRELFPYHTLIAEMVEGAPTNNVALTAWSERGGNAGTVVLDLQAISTDATLELELQHKKAEDDDSSATTDTTKISLSSATTGRQRYTGIGEVFRYRATLESDSTTPNISCYATFRVLSVSWEPN